MKLDLSVEPARLTYALVFEPSASDSARGQADRNGDGVVDSGEGRAELERWIAELRAALAVCRGKGLADLRCEKVGAARLLASEGVGFTEPAGKTLALSADFALELPSDERAVRVEDATFRPEVDRTDALIEPPAGVELVAAGAGDSPREGQIVRELKWNDDRQGDVRAFFVVWESRTPRWLVALIVGAAAALAVGQLLVSRLRRKSAGVATFPKRA